MKLTLASTNGQDRIFLFGDDLLNNRVHQVINDVRLENRRQIETLGESSSNCGLANRPCTTNEYKQRNPLMVETLIYKVCQGQH